jgi:hypothetical protein
MHENRETSATPAAQPGRRSAGEGLSHKARAYVYEESHSGVVPMNHSNKDGKLSAESGEGRPLIKENVRQPNTYPTQKGKGVSQGLADVRKAARDNKEMKFTALLHHLTVDLLRESFYSLKRKAAPGERKIVSGKRCKPTGHLGKQAQFELVQSTSSRDRGIMPRFGRSSTTGVEFCRFHFSLILVGTISQGISAP